MGKCLDLTGMLRGEGTPEVFFSFVSNSAEPWGLEVGNETLRRRKTALSLSSFSSSGSYTSLSVDHPLLTHQLPEGHGWVFPYLKKNDHLAGARALQKTGLGGEPSVGLRWGIQATSLFCRGCLPLLENWDKAATLRAASCCTSSHRLPPTDFQIRFTSPTVPNAGNHSWCKCPLKSQNQKKKEI